MVLSIINNWLEINCKYIGRFNMSVWQIFLLYFLKFGTLDSFPFYQQLSLLGMECGNSITSHVHIISGSTRIVKSRVSLIITVGGWYHRVDEISSSHLIIII